MRIRWDNVVIFALLLFATILLGSNSCAIGQMLSDMRTGKHQSPEQQNVFTFAVFGVILVSLVAIVRILVNKNQDR